MPSATIKWGNSFPEGEEPTTTVEFETQAELEAYLQGLGDGVGWMDYDIVEKVSEADELFTFLEPLLYMLEIETMKTEALNNLNGAYARAEYDDMDDSEVHIHLEFGIDEEGHHEHWYETYSIPRYILEDPNLTNEEKLRHFEN